jgi:hypothetical protein
MRIWIRRPWWEFGCIGLADADPSPCGCGSVGFADPDPSPCGCGFVALRTRIRCLDLDPLVVM